MHHQSVDGAFLFVVKLEIIKYIGQSLENWLKAGGGKCLEILWYLVGVQVPYASFSSTLRLHGETTFLSYTVVTGGGGLWE